MVKAVHSSEVGASLVRVATEGKQRQRHMRVASEISTSPRASPGTSSALCPPHMSLRNVQTDSRTCEQTDRWKISHGVKDGQPEEKGDAKKKKGRGTERQSEKKGQQFSQTESFFGVWL